MPCGGGRVSSHTEDLHGTIETSNRREARHNLYFTNNHMRCGCVGVPALGEDSRQTVGFVTTGRTKRGMAWRKAQPIAIQTSSDQCFMSPGCQRAQFEVAVQKRVTKAMAGNHSRMHVSNPASMMVPPQCLCASKHGKNVGTAVPSRCAHCSSHDSRGSKIVASSQLKRARARRFTLVQVVVEVDELYLGLKTCRWGSTGRATRHSLIAEWRRLWKTTSFVTCWDPRSCWARRGS